MVVGGLDKGVMIMPCCQRGGDRSSSCRRRHSVPWICSGGGIFDCIGAWAHDKLLKSDDDASNDDDDVYYYDC